MRGPKTKQIPSWRATTIVLAVALLSTSTAHAARGEAIEKWAASTAIEVAKELRDHPRFKNAAVRIVVVRDGQPTARPSQLELELRDILQRRIVGKPGVRVSSTNVIEQGGELAISGAELCPPAVQYLIGLDVVESNATDARATLRALDLVENAYVPGFRFAWRGTLNRTQSRKLRSLATDRSFLGDRSVPYEANETDLMARRLGVELRCALMREVSGDYVLHTQDDSSAESLGAVAELVNNHLSGIGTVRWSASPAEATAIVQGKAHRVDGDLHQYWLTVMPVDSAGDLKPLSASVYVRMPEQYMTASLDASAPPQNALFESLALVRQHRDACRASNPYSYRTNRGRESIADCWALRIKTTDDAVVFVLHHQQNNGLVRLADQGCGDRPTARIARAEESITFRLPADLLREEWRNEDTWRIEPDADTYYAIAISDSKAARELAAHVAELPERCTASVRPGYEGATLASWLNHLTAQFKQWQTSADWDAIRIKNVY